jgi:uncharacterized membrane protein AbrB (regulator of aidB expression)
VADVGVLVPIAVALIVKNGLSATAVLLPAALLYFAVAFVYQLPVPVQPLKAFGAIAIAKGLGSDEIAAGALLLTLALALGAGLAGLLTAFPLPILAGVLATAGVLHMLLLRDLHRARDWAVALLVGIVGFEVNLTVGLALGLALWWLPLGVRQLPRLRPATR